MLRALCLNVTQGENIRRLMYVCLRLQERRLRVGGWITCQEAWGIDVSLGKMSPENCHPTICSFCHRLHHIFFSRRPLCVISIHIHTCPELMWGYCTDRDKETAIWSRSLFLTLNYTIRLSALMERLQLQTGHLTAQVSSILILNVMRSSYCWRCSSESWTTYLETVYCFVGFAESSVKPSSSLLHKLLQVGKYYYRKKKLMCKYKVVACIVV